MLFTLVSVGHPTIKAMARVTAAMTKIFPVFFISFALQKEYQILDAELQAGVYIRHGINPGELGMFCDCPSERDALGRVERPYRRDAMQVPQLALRARSG